MSKHLIICFAVIVISWLFWKIRLKQREGTAKATFYERLSIVWEATARGYDSRIISPCFDEGLAYINSVPRSRRVCVKEKVYQELNRSYYYYLRMLVDEVERRLSENNCFFDKDTSLRSFFENNYRWLEINEMECVWYSIARYQKTKTLSREKKFLLTERDALYRRLSEKKEAEAIRKSARKREIREANIRRQKEKGFWVCMANPPG